MPAARITKRKWIEYVQRGGTRCPSCCSSNMEGGQVNFDDDWCSVNITCNDCGYKWKDIYTLSGIEEIV